MKNIYPVCFPRQETLADLYRRAFDRTKPLYAYPPYVQDSFQQRLHELSTDRGQSAPRALLADALRTYNKRVNRHPAVLDHIDMLEKEDSVVVIGGQQAGVLTGPLYTIYKAVTIIQLARVQREKLRVPVIPVFWVAGEDHDFEEANHIWVKDGAGTRLKRVRLDMDSGKKQPVGKRQIVNEDVEAFLREVADHHLDSAYKNQWLHKARELANRAETLSDWFAHMMHTLFADEGLVLIDSAAEEFKQAAAPFYAELLAKSDALHKAVQNRTEHVKKLGFAPQVQLQNGQANVFIEQKGERQLLFQEDGAFFTKNGEATYSREQLKEIARSHPEQLSTNVVTRPLLQTYLFPTLAAVTGPGEIAYWGQYGEAFSLFEWKMPILFPRVSFTLVERDVQKALNTFGLTREDAMFRLEAFREKWLDAQNDFDADALFSELETEVVKLHEDKTEPILSLDGGMADIAAKNRERIVRELRYLHNHVEKAIRLKHDASLKKLERIQLTLRPNHQLQERIFNVFSYVNQYGWEWLNALIRVPLDLTHSHYMVDL